MVMDLVERVDGDGLSHPVVDFALVLVLVLLVFLLSSSFSEGPGLPGGGNGSEEVDGKPAPSVTYDVRSQGVFPYEHTVRPGEKVGVYNSMSEEITLQRESGGSRNVEPGNYIIYELDRISYFEVNSSEGRVGSLKVNVQRP